MRFVTWNVHGCVGSDGLHDPLRTATVLRAMSADLIAMQEVHGAEPGRASGNDLYAMAQALKMEAIAGPARTCEQGYFGNAILTRYPVTDVRIHDISVPGREPRAVLAAAVQTPVSSLQVLVTHFGLRARERAQQSDTLVRLAKDFRSGPSLVAGDFNEWRPRAVTTTKLNLVLGWTPALRTFPARCPLLSLDRIWVNPESAVRRLSVCQDPLAVSASDHLPLLAEISWPA